MYLGCALKNAPKEFVDGVIVLRQRIEDELGFEILKFVDLSIEPRPTHEEIFLSDMNQIANCDCMVAICDEPSFGLGFEVRTALDLKKPVLMVATEGRVVSSFPQGVNLPGAAFARYTSFDHLISLIKEHFA